MTAAACARLAASVVLFVGAIAGGTSVAADHRASPAGCFAAPRATTDLRDGQPAQDDPVARSWTYRVRVADEATASRASSASPFRGVSAASPWDGANRFVATGDGMWTPGEYFHAGAGIVVLGGGNERDAAVRLRQAYARLSAASWLDVEGGKRLVRWGSGYAFTPTGLLDPPRDATDPQDRLGLNEGTALAQVALFRGETALTVAAAAPRAWRQSSAAPDRLFAAKLRTSTRGFEIAFVASAASGRRPSAGANFTHVLGDRFEWHGEWLLHDRISPWIARLEPSASGGRTTSALIGLQYTAPNGVNMVLEAYRDGNGLDAAAWDRLVSGARAALGQPGAPSAASARPSRRDFVFSRVARASTTSRWRPELTMILGVDDGSVTIVPTSGWSIREHVEVYVRAVALSGPPESEASAAPLRGTVMVGLAVRY